MARPTQQEFAMASIVGTWKLVDAVARDRDGKLLPAP
jgi:hypothetical protein